MTKNWQDLKKLGHKEKEQERRERERLEREGLEKGKNLKRNITLACVFIGVLIFGAGFMTMYASHQKKVREQFTSNLFSLKISTLQGNVKFRETAGWIDLQKSDDLSGDKFYGFKTEKDALLILGFPDGGGEIGIYGESKISLGRARKNKTGDALSEISIEFEDGEVNLKGIGKYPVIWDDKMWRVESRKGEQKIIQEGKGEISLIGKDGFMVYKPTNKKIEEAVVWQNQKLTFDPKGQHGPIIQPKLPSYRWF